MLSLILDPTFSSAVLAVDSEIAPEVEQASQMLLVFSIIMAAMFAVLILAAFIRRSQRRSESSFDYALGPETLFDPGEVEDLSTRLQLAEAAERAQLNGDLVSMLVGLANRDAPLAAVRSEVILAKNGGRQRLFTLVFDDTSALKVAVPASVSDDGISASKGLRLTDLEVSNSGRLTLVLSSRAERVTLEVVELTPHVLGSSN